MKENRRQLKKTSVYNWKNEVFPKVFGQAFFKKLVEFEAKPQGFKSFFEGVIKLMNKDILITKEMLLVWNVKNVEQQNIAKMDL